MTKSHIVEKNFSRDPDYYHLYADTQLYAADKLAALIAEQVKSPVKSILEIGCGTGFLTEKVMARFPAGKFQITDISPTMLKFCESQTRALREKHQIAAEFAENDISNCCPNGQYDLIVSSLAFQWVPNLEQTVKQLQSQLTPGGQLMFTTLSDGTFAAVKETFTGAKIFFPGPDLLTAEQIQSACNSFASVEISNETRTEEFSSMLEFLRHIQGTGAGNATGTPLQTAELKKILKRSDIIHADYNITYAVCK